MVAVKDLAEVVDHAKAELERLITLGRLQNDPLRYPLDALGVVLDALVDVMDEMRAVRAPGLTMTDQQVEVIGRRFAQAGFSQIVAIVRTELRRLLPPACGIAALLLVCGLGLGWLVWGRGPDLKCADRDGGRVCWVWTTPPR